MNLCFESMCDVYLSKTLWEMVIPFWIFSKWPFGDVLYKWITCTFVFNTFFTFVYRFVTVTITTEWQKQMNTFLTSMCNRFQVQHRKYQSFLYKTFKMICGISKIYNDNLGYHTSQIMKQKMKCNALFWMLYNSSFQWLSHHIMLR